MTPDLTRALQQPVSRRDLLRRAAGGAALLTSLAWLTPGVPRAAVAGGARPLAATEFDAAVATAWFDLMLRLIRGTPGYSPPVAARAVGCVGLTLYEAIVPGMPDHLSLAGPVNGLNGLPAAGRNAAYHWPTVANAALAAALRELFPTAPPDLQSEVAALEESLAATAGPPGVGARSTARGRDVAQAIAAWSRTDGGHEGYLRNFAADYRPPVGPGLWEPTPPGFLPALQPSWGANRCMALPTPDVGDPGPPLPFSTEPGSAFYADAEEMYLTVNGLTPEQRAVALFWADDPGGTATPPGHSVSIATQVLRARDASLALSAQTYAALGLAICDAFIACWRIKYTYNLIRPITYVRRHLDPTWGDPLPVTTPPFPEYTSGHSIQSAAAATVLTAQLGNVAFTDHTHDARGLAPRSFDSFEGFAAEAAISRLYGGIHFRAAVERGMAEGRAVGETVAALPWQG
jgi:hypothetical protein